MLLFKSVEGDDEEVYQTLCEDNSEGEGALISSWSIRWMCIKKAEVAWTEIRFESKLQSHHTDNSWVLKVMAILVNTSKMLVVGVKRAPDRSRAHSITRVYEELEVLVSEWNADSLATYLLLLRESLDKLACFEPYGPASIRRDERMAVTFEE